VKHVPDSPKRNAPLLRAVYVPEIETGRHVKNNVCTGNQNKMDDTKTYDIRKHIVSSFKFLLIRKINQTLMSSPH
jgi:hypothetical protein